MKNLVVDADGSPVGDIVGDISSAVGRRVSVPVRLVTALPVRGGEVVPLVLTQGIAGVEASGSVVVAGRDRVYVSRLVWAAPD